MSRDWEHEPAKQPPTPPPWAEPPVAPEPFYAMPDTVATGGEIVVPQQQPVVNAQQPWPPPLQQTGPVAGRSANPVSPQPQGQGVPGRNRAQLQRLCRRLRATHRCPGECVLSRARQNRRLRRFPDLR
jgi:hypothetical protein